MGMFDTIRFHGGAAPLCAAGHSVTDLQTKDLDCTMSVYSVCGERMYRPGKSSTESVRVDDETGHLILSTTTDAEPAAISADLRAYSSCRECRPVLYLNERGFHGDYVHERLPWCEWRIVLRDGRLERREIVRVESREEVATALRREGLEVLADEERLARLHFDRKGKSEWSDW